MRDCFLARPDFTPRRQILFDDLVHPRFDLGEIVGLERGVAREIVIEAGIDGRADGDLGSRIEVLHRHGEDMRRVMADHLEGFRVLAGDDPKARVGLDGTENVPFLAIYLDGQGCLGQARTDGGSHVGTRHAARERHRLAVGQGDSDVGRWQGRGHGHSPVVRGSWFQTGPSLRGEGLLNQGQRWNIWAWSLHKP